jgi:hypothetical protein
MKLVKEQEAAQGMQLEYDHVKHENLISLVNYLKEVKRIS